MFEDDNSVLSAVRAVARGYVLKGATHAEVVRAIRAVAEGDALFGPTIAARLTDFFANAAPMLIPQMFPELSARRYLGNVDPKHPLASPLCADLEGLPPLFVQMGEDEVLLDDARRLGHRAQAADVEATLEVWPGMWHIFRMQRTFPESRHAMRRLAAFLRRQFLLPQGGSNCNTDSTETTPHA